MWGVKLNACIYNINLQLINNEKKFNCIFATRECIGECANIIISKWEITVSL